MTTTKTKPRDLTSGFSRFAYITYLLLGLYFLLFKKDVADAMSMFGIGLIFDPFKQEIRWNSRPFYQKAILIAHVSVVFILLAMMAVDFFQYRQG